MGLVARRVADKRLLRLIRGFLAAGVFDGGLVGPTTKGTPQGGPLSPLLSNLMLDVLDKELETRGHRFVRYADDCNLYVRSRRAGERVMAGVTRFLARRLKLTVNAAKSAVDRPSARAFLGFSFTAGPTPQRVVSPKALARFKTRVRELTCRTKRVSFTLLVEELSRYLVGWRGYFGLCEVPYVLLRLDQWTRRRLRAVAWTHWKRGSTRFAALRRRGVGKRLAAQTASSAHGPWRISHSPALSIALPNAFFARIGLASVAAGHAASTSGHGGGFVPRLDALEAWELASRRCAVAASVRGWRPRPLAAPTAPGGSATARHSVSRCPTPSSPESASHPSPQAMPLNSVEPPCTDPYARWCGRGGAARLPPIPICASALPGDTPPVPPLGEQLWALRPRLDGGVPAVNGFTPDARRAVDGWAGACAVTWRSGGRKRGGFWAAEASNYGHSPPTPVSGDSIICSMRMTSRVCTNCCCFSVSGPNTRSN